jgi:hypothetical protein
MPSKAALRFAAAYAASPPQSGGNAGETGETLAKAAEIRPFGHALPFPGHAHPDGESGEAPAWGMIPLPGFPAPAEGSGENESMAKRADFCPFQPAIPASPAFPGGNENLMRPVSWPNPAATPPPGAWCSCCGRHERQGGQWWRELEAPTGWRCYTCHPPLHLDENAVWVVRT